MLPNDVTAPRPSPNRDRRYRATTVREWSAPMIPESLSARGGAPPPNLDTIKDSLGCAPVAQLDRAFASGAKGRWFESTRAYHKTKHLTPFAFFFAYPEPTQMNGSGRPSEITPRKCRSPGTRHQIRGPSLGEEQLRTITPQSAATGVLRAVVLVAICISGPKPTIVPNPFPLLQLGQLPEEGLILPEAAGPRCE